jgi:D-alanine-D-alanine ligase
MSLDDLVRSRATGQQALRVAILVPPRMAGARPDQDDTFVQASEVAACLTDLGHRPIEAQYDGAATEDTLRALAPDVVVNLVEEVPEGPDQLHCVTALLDRLRLRYTGARTATLETLGRKLEMKRVLRDAGLPTAPLLEHAPEDARFIVKSALEHASLGLDDDSVVEGAVLARRLIAQKHATYGGPWFAETYVEGREFDVGMLEVDGRVVVFPPAEILFTGHANGRPRIFSYASKWDEGSDSFEATPRVFPPREAELFSRLEELALASWRAFGITGCAHVDFRVDEHGEPFVLEVNCNPCLTSDAGYCLAAAEIGISQADIVAAMLAAA